MSSSGKQDCQYLVRKRGALKASVTRFMNFIAKFDESQITELEFRLENLKLVLNEFETVQNKIENLDLENDHDETVREEFENMYLYKALASGKQLLKSINISHSASFSNRNVQLSEVSNLQSLDLNNITDINSVRFPTINLPEFDGNYENWFQFRDVFNTLVDSNSKLKDVQKFMYLSLSLKGPAAEVIKALGISSHTVALELLKEHFENKKIIVNSHMRSMFELENLSRESSGALRHLLDEFLKHFRSLEALGLPVDHWDIPLVYILTSKFDHNTRKLWEQYSKGSSLPTITEMLSFLKDRCQVLESIANSNTIVKSTQKPKAVANLAFQKLNYIHCSKSHSTYQCQNLLKKTPEERLKIIKDLKACTNCLGPRHTAQQCKSTRSCFKCQKRHHTLLDVSHAQQPITVTSHSFKKINYVLLSTAVVHIKNRRGKLIQIRALIDSGSDSNYITTKLFNKIGSRYHGIDPITIAGVNGTTSTVNKQIDLTINSIHKDYHAFLTFLIVDGITERIPTIALDVEHLNIPLDINLADPEFYKPEDSDMLIGTEIFFELIDNGKIILGRNKPILRDSKLGWLVTGRLNLEGLTRSFCHLSIKDNSQLHKELERFWKFDDYPGDKIFSTNEVRCEKDFIQNTTRDETGRYTVALPFADNKELLTLEHMKRVSSLTAEIINEHTNKAEYYIPHHPVFKASSSTTKLRVVFDASSPTTTGLSLNNVLLVGPIIQSELFSILMRFRKHNVALIADIEKMFRQVNVKVSRQDADLEKGKSFERLDDGKTQKVAVFFKRVMMMIVLSALVAGGAAIWYYFGWSWFLGYCVPAILVLLIAWNYNWCYVAAVTVPRDFRALYKYVRTLMQIKKYDKKNLTVAEIFSQNAQIYPNREAVVTEDRSFTFLELEEFANRIANVFKSHGYKKGDVIALYLENKPEYVGIWLGLSKIGVIVPLINSNLKQKSLIHSITIAKSQAIIFGSELREEILSIKLDLDSQLTLYQFTDPKQQSCENSFAGIQNINELLKTANTTPPVLEEKPGYHDGLVYIYTSGTTGLPKAAVITNSRYIFIAVAIHWLAGFEDDDRFYTPLPLYHTAGGCMSTGQMLLFGSTLITRKKFSASQYFNDCHKYKATVAQYIGEMCRYVLATPPSDSDKKHKLKLIYGNGLRPQIWSEFVSRFNIPKVAEFYGATEGNANIVNVDNTVGAIGFVSRILPFVYPISIIRVDPETGEPIRTKDGFCVPCKPDEPGVFIGKIQPNNPSRAFLGYVDQEASKKKVVHDVFRKGDSAFLSGDIIMADKFGNLFFMDRTGDTFRWKGENVSTSEVEAVVSNIVDYKDCVVYGVEINGQEGRAGMAAILDPENKIDLRKMADSFKKDLPSYARPIFIRVLNKVDMTGTYKLKKIDLQKEGFNPSVINDPMYYSDPSGQFLPLTSEKYKQINDGTIRV